MNNNNNVISLWPNIYWKHRKCNGVSDNPIRGRNALTKIYTNFRKRYQKNLASFSPEFYCTIIRSTQPLKRTLGWNFLKHAYQKYSGL